MAYELKDYLKAINESKEDLMKSDETWIKKYPAYIINRCLSMFWDTLPQANEMNGYHFLDCLLYTSPSPRDRQKSRMPSSA